MSSISNAVIAEKWWARQGNAVPEVGTKDWITMFQAWIARTLTRDF